MTVVRQVCILCVLVVILLSCGCNHTGGTSSDQSRHYRVLNGLTMGTYYRITYQGSRPIDLQRSVDSLLKDINSVVSTYEPSSYISKINKAHKDDIFEDLPEHFKVNLRTANDWYDKSDGYLDVSIMPLVNYWGFGYQPKHAVTHVDSIYVDSIMYWVGLDQWDITDDALSKQLDQQQLDFSALAKGYAVDMVGQLLQSKGCEDYLVDIGGEYVAKGMNASDKLWSIGLSTPSPDAAMTDVEMVIRLDNQALASSGNYRNYHEVNGKKYGHTLSPKTGYPYQDELLGVTVITHRCIDADAIATACMAMGYKKALTFIQSLPEVAVCFFIGDESGTIKTKFSNGFIRSII